MPTIWFQAEAPRRSTRVYTGKLGEQLLTAISKPRAVSTCILYYYDDFFYPVRITLLVVRVLEEARGRPGRGDLAVSQIGCPTKLNS